MKKNVLWIFIILILLLIVLSNIKLRSYDAQDIFVRMFGFELPESAQIKEFHYSEFSQEASFDVVIPDDQIGDLKTNMYAFIAYQTADVDDARIDKDDYPYFEDNKLNFLERYWFFLHEYDNEFPYKFKLSGKKLDWMWMMITFAAEKGSGAFHLQVIWWKQ